MFEAIKLLIESMYFLIYFCVLHTEIKISSRTEYTKTFHVYLYKYPVILHDVKI